jgi:hypothetical protein
MPADLRRMQGTWKVVKILTNDDKRVNFGNEIEAIFAGRYLILNVPHRAPIEIQDGHFRIFDVPEDERTILGVTVQTPSWWRRPVRVIYGTYEFADQQLIFWLKGGKDLRDNTVEEREDQQLRVYLERR